MKSENLKTKDTTFSVFNNVFTTEELEAAARVLSKETRKMRWDNIDSNTNLPKEILRAASRIRERLPEFKFNSCIMKRYSVTDGSGAYELHRDPDEFMSQPLILITLSGLADLSIEVHPNEFGTIRCKSGTVLTLHNPTLKHKVTPPLNKEGLREILFFGYSQT